MQIYIIASNNLKNDKHTWVYLNKNDMLHFWLISNSLINPASTLCQLRCKTMPHIWCQIDANHMTKHTNLISIHRLPSDFDSPELHWDSIRLSITCYYDDNTQPHTQFTSSGSLLSSIKGLFAYSHLSFIAPDKRNRIKMIAAFNWNVIRVLVCGIAVALAMYVW